MPTFGRFYPSSSIQHHISFNVSKIDLPASLLICLA